MTTMTLTERFLNYTKFDTQSAEDSQTVPSTSKQLVFAKYLKEELQREGLEDVAYMDALEKVIARAESAAAEKRPPATVLTEAKRLLAEREAIVKSDDQVKLDVWRLAVGRAIDGMGGAR